MLSHMQGSANFFSKGLRVNILGSVGHTVSRQLLSAAVVTQKQP